MATTRVQIFVSIVLLLQLVSTFSSATSDYAPASVEKKKKHSEVVVEGMVYCQSCEHKGSSCLTDATPIPSARISVICKNKKKHISYYKAFNANKDGYFYAQLEEFNMNDALLEHPLISCGVRLVASNDKNCSSLTNVNGALNADGARLRYEGKVQRREGYEVAVYAAGPVAFRPTCSQY
ncbi:hypothetical protein ACFE04_029184 [Oxalis oulophora]